MSGNFEPDGTQSSGGERPFTFPAICYIAFWYIGFRPTGHHASFSFSNTNLHTHGLHTDPVGTKQYAGDNVLIDIAPGHTQEYKIKIPENHASGTFWYHAHLHGSTALQLASGMAGALIAEGNAHGNGDLDSVPSIHAAYLQEKIFVLQQLDFDENGELESFDPFRTWQRHITVNGQLVPTIRMRPGEVQRWRFIHAGTSEYIPLALDEYKLFEVAADGISMGRIVPWPAVNPFSGNMPRDLFLAPGYRSDALVKANQLQIGETSHEYFLRDTELSASLSLQARKAAVRLFGIDRVLQETLAGNIPGKSAGIVARVIVEGSPANMELPSNDQLLPVVPSSLPPISTSELTGQPHKISLAFSPRRCTSDGLCKDQCEFGDKDCEYRAMINDRVFMPKNIPTILKLNTASEWTITNGDPAFAHPFHIHVNPFQVDREEPDAEGGTKIRSIWKDTMIAPSDGSPLILRSGFAAPLRIAQPRASPMRTTAPLCDGAGGSRHLGGRLGPGL